MVVEDSDGSCEAVAEFQSSLCTNKFKNNQKQITSNKIPKTILLKSRGSIQFKMEPQKERKDKKKRRNWKQRET